MAETDAIIRISAVGGDEASAALGKVTEGFQAVEGEHNKLVDQFSHRFTHIGLQLFVGEALRAAGVGAETRQVISTLQLAMMSAAGAFGAAAGPIMLVGTALIAVIGLSEKMSEHHKANADALVKLTEAEIKDADALNKEIDKLKEFVALNGPHADAIKKVLDAKILLQSFEESIELVNLAKQKAALEDQIRTEIKHIEAMQAAEKAQKSLTIERILAITVGQGINAGIQATVLKYSDMKKSIEEAIGVAMKHNDQLKETLATLELLSAGEHRTWQEVVDDYNKVGEAAKKRADEEAEAETKMYQKMAEEHAKKSDLVMKKNEEVFKKFEEIGNNAIDSVAGSFANSFVKMAFEGQNFVKSMEQAFMQLTEQVIADIIKMEIEMAIFQAMSGGSGALSEHTFNFVHGGGQAEGGSYMVDRPTLFMAGEAGQPEMATFTPLSKMGNTGSMSSSESGSSVQIGTIQTNVYGIQDADAIADKVGLKIAERIRGQGEINFTRAF